MKTNGLYIMTGLLMGLLMWFIYDRIETTLQDHKAEKYFAQRGKGLIGDDEMTPFSNEQLEQIKISDLEGNPKRVTDSDERPIFINLWASWSIPCMKEMQAIERLYNQMKGKMDFYIISHEKSERIKRIARAQEFDLPFYILSDMNDLPPFLRKTSIPYTYVIFNGEIRMEYEGSAPWDSETVIHYINGLIDQEESQSEDQMIVQGPVVMNVINFF